MMASRAKKAEVFAALRQDGCSAKMLGAVHCPIGITIKSHTPPEIAISIAAEIIGVKNGGAIAHS
jgi:xanthine dehydrogenase accessory factor